MSAMRPQRGEKNEAGVSLVEQMLAALFIGFLVMVWVNSIRVATKGTIQSKNNLRAQNLGLSKLEDEKNLANQASYASTWDHLTETVLVSAYRTPQVTSIENKAYTWQVNTQYAWLPITTTANSLSYTPT